MSAARPINGPPTGADAPPAAHRPDGHQVTLDDFRASFGEELQQTIDLGTWQDGHDLESLYQRVRHEVEQAARQESDLQKTIRHNLFPRLAQHGPDGAGWFRASEELIRELHAGLLFRGGVEACASHHQAQETLPLTVHQIGIALVSYSGQQQTLCQRLFRREYEVRGGDPLQAALAELEQRSDRAARELAGRRDLMSELARRALRSFAERRALLERSTACWRIGAGSLAPLELLNGAGSADLMIESIRLLRRLI